MQCGVLTGGLLPRSPAHEVREDVNGDGEDNGAVLLGRDIVQCLQVTQLQLTKTTMVQEVLINDFTGEGVLAIVTLCTKM